MATQISIDQVQSMYIAYYGRPGDPAGLEFWSERLDTVAGNLDAIVDAFGSSPEYEARFDNNLSNEARVNQLYQNILGRDADGAGLAFYASNLDSGAYSLASLANRLWDGATGSDAVITANKLTVANDFASKVVSEHRVYSSDDIPELVSLLSSVNVTTNTNDESAVDAVIANLDVQQVTIYEQYMLELINRARSDPGAELNRQDIDSLNEGLESGSISSDPSQPLAFNDVLSEVAWDHNAWMLEESSLSHVGESGSQLGGRLDAAGYDAISFGENLAVTGVLADIGHDEMIALTQRLFDNLFVDTDVDGRGHRVNLLNGNFKEIGIAVDNGDFNFTTGNATFNSVITTQDFGARDAEQAILLGVVFGDADNDDFYTPGEGKSGIQVSVYLDSDGQFDSPMTSGMTAINTVFTQDAGGYQVELDAGQYDIIFTDGNGISHMVNDVVVGVDNVKEDWMF